MKKVWYLIWILIFLLVLGVGYSFLKQANNTTIQVMLIFIMGVILARIIITPLVAILVHRHDRIKEQAEQERKENDEKH
ncbi:hypothetical protein ACQW5G_07265 [Fructilactobacillus sp. Tb1]|uniref:hypothetical protein n=1 Tax=Fructilactobacillus sp. Tb1 TaxID=3422304 RepID=UPI003D266A5B